jgi:Tfp pilus assembly protein PilZ
MNGVRFEVRKARPTRVQLISRFWDEPVEMTAADISPGGLFLPSSLLLEAGEPVVACFSLPGHRQEFQVFGNVAWVAIQRRATDLGEAGMGVSFVKTTAKERIGIRLSLRSVPPPLPNKKSVATHSRTMVSERRFANPHRFETRSALGASTSFASTPFYKRTAIASAGS